MLKIETQSSLGVELVDSANRAKLQYSFNSGKVVLSSHSISDDLKIFDTIQDAIKYLRSLDKFSAPEKL
jgi:hypothetical protein